MWKIIGGVVVGVFVGALAFEIISRRRPGLIKEIEHKAGSTASTLLEAFGEGYRGENANTGAA